MQADTDSTPKLKPRELEHKIYRDGTESLTKEEHFIVFDNHMTAYLLNILVRGHKDHKAFSDEKSWKELSERVLEKCNKEDTIRHNMLRGYTPDMYMNVVQNLNVEIKDRLSFMENVVNAAKSIEKYQ